MKNTILANNRRLAHVTIAVAVMIGGASFLPAATLVHPGDQRQWTLAFRTRLEQPGGARPIEIDLNGDWVSTVVAVRPHEFDAALQLTNARLSSGANNVPANQREQMSRRLERTFWATYRDDGGLASVHFYQETDPSDRNLLQMVATECQFVQAPADRSSWTVVERDGAGQYTAVYNRTSPNVVAKRKTNYLRADGAPQQKTDDVRMAIDRSEFRFTLDEDGGIATLDGGNRVLMGVTFGNAGQLAAVTEVHLSGLRKSQSREMIGSLSRARAEVVSSPVRTHQPNPEQLRARLDGQLLDGHTTESLLEAAALDTEKSEGADHLLGDRLAALFRQRPESPAAALDLLRKTGPRSRITDALGIAGSAAAIETLGVIARDRNLSRPLRIDALTAFILMQHPGVQAMRMPAALLDDDDAAIAAAARIASGGLAHAGRADHPEEAAAIDAALVLRYRKAHEATEATNLLVALGNSAGKSALPVIQEALRDPREAVRAAAAGALRLVDAPEVDGLLSATIVNDRDAAVRASAIFAATFHHPLAPKIGDALVHAAKMDPAEHVRVAAINLLRKNSAAAPHLAETLSWIAQHDPKPGVRLLAQDALKAL
ncbi:MAG TPA: HEAT repeat domain-containing protein [Bryobacteraceae bacterium]|nr:HEAT repeat domain-containing protein [Bryobacteraceae bacterium]